MQHDDAQPESAPPGPLVNEGVPGQPTYGEVAGTGNAAVDEVLRTLEDLEERPAGEHVQVFERAHERLRRALDATDHGNGG